MNARRMSLILRLRVGDPTMTLYTLFKAARSNPGQKDKLVRSRSKATAIREAASRSLKRWYCAVTVTNGISSKPALLSPTTQEQRNCVPQRVHLTLGQPAQ